MRITQSQNSERNSAMFKLTYPIITIFFLAFLGCQKEGPTSPEEKGKISLGFSLKAAKAVGANVTRVSVSISKETFADSLDLAASADSAWGTFTNLVPGTYTIFVKVYDGTSLLGTGSGQGTVATGQTTTVRITINFSSGNLQVIVDWNITSSITLSGRQIRGLAYDSGVLWAIHSVPAVGNIIKISKINISNGQILLESSDKPWNGRGITVGGGALWIADAFSDVIRKIDPSNFNQLASFSTPGSEPNGITFDGSSLWLTDPYFQKIYKLNTSGGVISNFNIPNAFRTGLEWEGIGMWTNTDTNKVSFYTTAGIITATKTLGHNIGFDIAIGNGKVYASSGDKIYILNW